MAIERELSLALVGLAGGLLVGNFAAFNGFLAMANASGDTSVTWLLTASTVLLTLSIILGGNGISDTSSGDPGWWYNLQAVAGLLGLIAALSMPLLSLAYRDAPNSNQADQIAVLQQALATAGRERSQLLDTNANLEKSLAATNATLAEVQKILKNPPQE